MATVGGTERVVKVLQRFGMGREMRKTHADALTKPSHVTLLPRV